MSKAQLPFWNFLLHTLMIPILIGGTSLVFIAMEMITLSKYISTKVSAE